MIDLHLAVPNNNKRDLLARSLAALPAASRRITLSVTVVDNASTDGSADMVARDFPDVRLIRRAAMHGSSSNFNAGILDNPQARYLGVLHEDAFPQPDALDALVAFLDSHPRAGGVSPRIRFPDGELDTTPARFPTVLGSSLGHLRPLHRRFGLNGYDELAEQAFRVDYNSATCLVFRREALLQSGLFDESFAIFYEEVDLSRRLADAAWETWFVPTVEVVHAGGVTRQRAEVTPEVQARYRAIANHFLANKYLYCRKHLGRLAELQIRAIDALVAGTRLALLPLDGWVRGRTTRDELASDIDRQRNALRAACLSWPRLDPQLQRRLPAGDRE